MAPHWPGSVVSLWTVPIELLSVARNRPGQMLFLASLRARCWGPCCLWSISMTFQITCIHQFVCSQTTVLHMWNKKWLGFWIIARRYAYTWTIGKKSWKWDSTHKSELSWDSPTPNLNCIITLLGGEVLSPIENHSYLGVQYPTNSIGMTIFMKLVSEPTGLGLREIFIHVPSQLNLSGAYPGY